MTRSARAGLAAPSWQPGVAKAGGKGRGIASAMR